MSSIIYGNLRIDLIDEHGALIRRQTLTTNALTLRPWPQDSAAEPPANLLGRATEVAAANEALPGYPVEFVAPCGYGKSTLLRHVTAQHAHTGTRAVYLRAADGLDDLRQQLFERCYHTRTPVKPTPEQYVQLLAQIRGVVVLDDFTGDSTQTRQLVQQLPGCAVVIGTGRPTQAGIGRSFTLNGLPTDAAMRLLRDELGRELTGAEHADALRLCEAVDRQPLHLRQAAALVRHGHTLSELARLAREDPSHLDRLSVNALGVAQRRVLAVLALAAGALLPADLLQSALDVAEVTSTLTDLQRRGLAERRSDRFGLPVCHKDQYRQLLADHIHLGEAVRGIADWLSNQNPTGDDARAAAHAALTIIGYAAERGDWPAVQRLVKVSEQVLCLAGRFDAWRRALEHGIHAARLVADQATLAHLNHQLGVLEFSLDQLELAAFHWQQALQLRRGLRDRTGAARTQANLDLLTPAPAEPVPYQQPDPPDTSRRRRWRAPSAAWAAVVFLVLLAAGYPVVRSAASGSANAGRTNPPTSNAAPAGVPTSASTTGPVQTSAAASRTAGPNPAVTVLDPVSVPASYSGYCPTTVTSTASIRVSGGVARVSYQWIRSDGTATPTQTVTLGGNAPDSRTVQDAWQVGGATTYNGWEALRLLTPQDVTSARAAFTLLCIAPPQARVDTVTLPPPSTACGSAPVLVSGTITVFKGPLQVAYRWVFADGTATPVKKVAFLSFGKQSATVQATWMPRQTDNESIQSGWAAIELTEPVAAKSDRTAFIVTCPAVPG